jgi:hypothetical protein
MRHWHVGAHALRSEFGVCCLRRSSVSEAMEDAVLFMVRYLQEVQGPKHVVGRDFAYIAATPEARRLFLATARHLMLQVGHPCRRTSLQQCSLTYLGLSPAALGGGPQDLS